jgi:hypothetical protein
VRKLGAKADAMADKKNRAAAHLSTGFLPNLSLKGPAVTIANVAVSDKDATAHPNSILDKLNSGSINLTTPDITDASKPIRKPPKATMMDT